jgi:large subunit ribosomal protein L5
MSTQLRSYYKNTVIPSLMEQFNYTNIHEVPKVTKVTINRGLGEASRNNKALETSTKEVALITGQQPVITKARTSVAGFKIREGVPVGMAVTLRKDVMYSFLERLIHLSLPRIRDFKGISIK